jgi:CHAT domain-containing protein/tetratricopeptide (TPR) repeat protein
MRWHRQLCVSLGVIVLATLPAGLVAADDPVPGGESPKSTSLTEQQRSQLREADRLVKEANALRTAGKLSESVEQVEKALAIRREVLGPEHEQVLQILQGLARVLERNGDKEAARKRLQEVVTIQEHRFGKDDWRVIDARLAVADLDQRVSLSEEQRRQLDEAERLSRDAATLGKQGRSAAGISSAVKARDAYKSTLGERNNRYIASLNSLAGLYRVTGNNAKALPLLLEARDLRKALMGERHPEYATSLTNLAMLHQAMGDYARALPLFLEARDVRKASLGQRHPDYALSLNNLAMSYRDTGEHAKAIPLLLEAVEIWKVVRGERHLDYIGGLGNLAGLYQEMGDYAKALPLFLQVRDVYKAALGERHPAYARSLSNLGLLYRDMGDNEKAAPLLQEALAIRKAVLGERDPDYARSLDNLAMLRDDMGNYDEELRLLLQVRDLRKASLGERHPDYARTLTHLAMAYHNKGNDAEAVPLYRQALDTWKAGKGERRAEYSLVLNNLALLYQKNGEYDKALPLMLEARDLTKATAGERHPNYALSLQNLACLYHAKGDVEQAKALYRESYDLTRDLLDLSAGAQAERQQLLMAAFKRNRLDHYLSLLVAANQPAAEAYAPVLDAKGAVLARKKWDHLAESSDPETARLGEEFRSVSGRLAARALATPPPAQKQKSWHQELQSIEEERERLEQQLASRSAAFRADRTRQRATAEQVRDTLPDGTALVDFLEYNHFSPRPGAKGDWPVERRLVAFILRHGRPAVMVALGPAAPIAEAITAWRSPMESSSPAPVDDEAARTLSRLVWLPLHPHLDGASTVLISPDGVLCGFPFAALPGDKPGSYLIEERAVGYVPSARALIAIDEEGKRRAAGMLGVGDVDYGKRPAALATTGPRRPLFGPLPGTRPEVERVAAAYRAAFPDGVTAKVLTGSAPDAAVLKRELTADKDKSAYRFVHLACHGFFEPIPAAPTSDRTGAAPLNSSSSSANSARLAQPASSDPLLRSGLALAGVNASPESGTLTASEVAGLDLGGCELAVLSACETGLGTVTNGEGVRGLQRAFDQAGARTLVASLWSVNDAGTSVLMEEFYANLWAKKLPKLEALRQAQLTVLRHPERVEKRSEELRGELKRRGVSADVLAKRGFDWNESNLPAAAGTEVKESTNRRSHPALWAAFVMSGDFR